MCHFRNPTASINLFDIECIFGHIHITFSRSWTLTIAEAYIATCNTQTKKYTESSGPILGKRCWIQYVAADPSVDRIETTFSGSYRTRFHHRCG